MRPPKSEVTHKVGKRDNAQVSAEKRNFVSCSGPWVQIPVLAPAGREGPWRSLLLMSFPISSRGPGAPPPSPSSRPLPARFPHPSHSPFPFRSLPVWACSSPRQDRGPRLPVRKSRQGSRRAEEKPKWGEGTKETCESPCGSQGAAASASSSDWGTWTPGRKPRPINKGSLSAHHTFATPSKWKATRDFSEVSPATVQGASG